MDNQRELALSRTDEDRDKLQTHLEQLIARLGSVPIASNELMPFGWRKSAKGRTVWRIIEEVISQNLELRANELGFQRVVPAASEVGVFDFKITLANGRTSYVNIKSSVVGTRASKDDISKALQLKEFFEKNPNTDLFIATFLLQFNPEMTVGLAGVAVMPVAWIPDVYVNPSNNGNLQSSHAKHIERAVKRTNADFLAELNAGIDLAASKRNAKNGRVN